MYKLNYKSCQYKIEKEDKLIKNMGGSDILKSEDAGWGFGEDFGGVTLKLEVDVEDIVIEWDQYTFKGATAQSEGEVIILGGERKIKF